LKKFDSFFKRKFLKNKTFNLSDFASPDFKKLLASSLEKANFKKIDLNLSILEF
jgi:hypothetical protein